MYSKSQLLRQLVELGIEPTDTITVHTSLKAIGETESGAEGLIEVLREAVHDGLLLIPTHTYVNISELPSFNVRTTLPCIGTLPRIAMELANSAVDSGDTTCRRSLHPSHSVVAFGKSAAEYIENDAFATTAMPLDGSYGKLHAVHGKILLVGVDLTKNTFIHVIDEQMRGGIAKNRHVTVVDYDGGETVRDVLDTYGRSSYYERYRPALDKAGALSYGRLGDADVIVCDAAICYDTITALPLLRYD